MKFEPIRFRETLLEFFGKNGISWHGSVVLYRIDSSRGDHEDDAASATLSTMVMDHIADSESTQDIWTVSSIFNAVFSRLKKEFPAVSDVWLVTDNARKYQNEVMPVISPDISSMQGMRLRGFVHPETKRVKGLVDAHSSVSMRYIHRFVRET